MPMRPLAAMGCKQERTLEEERAHAAAPQPEAEHGVSAAATATTL